VSLGVSDVSEDADGTTMSQTADQPLLHMLQQLLHKQQTEMLFVSTSITGEQLKEEFVSVRCSDIYILIIFQSCR